MQTQHRACVQKLPKTKYDKKKHPEKNLDAEF